jgi:hypothetical protein
MNRQIDVRSKMKLTFFLQESLQPPENDFSFRLIKLVTKVIKGSKDIRKILDSIELIVDLFPFKAPTRPAALKLMISMMVNRYPKVRQVAAEQLYVSLITFEDILANFPSTTKETILDIVSNTQWDSPVEFIKAKVQTLANLILNLSVASPASDEL